MQYTLTPNFILLRAAGTEAKTQMKYGWHIDLRENLCLHREHGWSGCAAVKLAVRSVTSWHLEVVAELKAVAGPALHRLHG